jgi:predicted esterase
VVTESSQDPHAHQPLLRRGPSPSDARLVAILVHGRGGSADDILSLTEQLNLRDVAYLAPQAAGRTWYPHSFLAPLEQNEPGISSGLRRLSGLVEELVEQGIPPARVGLLGFSQGACLALEFAARHPQRYAAVVGLSGALISPPGTPHASAGSLQGTPVFLGCSDIDPHIPLERVREAANVFRQLGAVVDERIYPHMGHTVSRDEVLAVQALFDSGSSVPSL